MARARSAHVCFRCGLPVHYRPGRTWQHVANQYGRSCGKPPLACDRARLEAKPHASVEAVRRFTNH